MYSSVFTAEYLGQGLAIHFPFLHILHYTISKGEFGENSDRVYVLSRTHRKLISNDVVGPESLCSDYDDPFQ